MPGHYKPTEQTTHALYMDLLHSACDELGVALSWLPDNWVAQLHKNDADCLITGYQFPLNTAVTSNLFRDKSALAQLLNHSGIAAIPHYFLRLPAADAAEHAMRLTALPLVVKPNLGDGGDDVYKCTTPQEVTVAVKKVAMHTEALAISPFIAIAHEYRVVMLDGQALLTFEKIRQAGQWQHNLGLGAQPHIVEDAQLKANLAQLAKTAVAATNGRLGAVDIAATPDGLHIIEINSGISLSHFSEHSAAYREQAVAVYRAIIAASLGLSHTHL